MYKVGTVAQVKGVVLGVLLRVGLVFLIPFISVGAGSVNLAWDPSADSGVAGYNIYYGISSRSYPNQVATGTNLTAAISNLADGNTYYFAVTAVDALGNESDYSNEISYSIAGVNQPPTISSIPNKSVALNHSTGAIAFTVGDPDTSVSSLTLSGASSNTTLVPNANIVFGGSAQNRTVTVTPATGQSGVAQITVSVSDGTSSVNTSFTLTVQGVNTPPTISTIPNQSTYSGQAIAGISFTIGDAETPASSLTLSATSSNPTLIPNSGVTFGGSAQNRTVTLTPATGKTGSAQITVSVSDGTNSASSSFTLAVQGTNKPPTISSIPDQTGMAGHNIVGIPFTISDPETPASSLILSATSSNPTLIPNSGVVFGGSAQNRTLALAPISGQSGTTQITISVSDKTNSASTSFMLTIQSTNTVPGTNTPPTISTIPDQSGYTGQATAAIPFTIGDGETPAANLVLSETSSNPTLIPDAGVVFGGSGQNRTVTITPAPDQTGSGQLTITVSDGTNSAQTTFTLTVVQPTALLTSELAKSSTYNGLFYEGDAVRVQSAGAFKLTVTSAGKYSGSVQMAAGTYSFSGLFGTVCQATNVILRKNGTPLSINFSLNPGISTNQFSGNLSDGVWAAEMHGARAVFNLKTNPAPYLGNYTLAIPGQDTVSSFSLGHGYGSLKVDGNGNVKFAGMLADGTKISQSAPLSSDGTWPLFVPLYAGKGLVIAWISFANRPTDDLHGALNWIKLPDSAARYYPGGLTLGGDAVGSIFAPASALALNVEVATLQASGPGNGQITSLKLSLGNGTFKGSLLDQTTGLPVVFQGALLQKPNAGYGFVLRTNQSTPVMLTP